MDGMIKVNWMGGTRWVRPEAARAELAALEAKLDAAMRRAHALQPSAPNMAEELRYFAAAGAALKLEAEAEALRKALGIEPPAKPAPEPAPVEEATAAEEEPAAAYVPDQHAVEAAVEMLHGHYVEAETGFPLELGTRYYGCEVSFPTGDWTQPQVDSRSTHVFLAGGRELPLGTLVVCREDSKERVVARAWNRTITLQDAPTATSEWLPAEARPEAPAFSRLLRSWDVERLWEELLGEAPDQIALRAWEAKRAAKRAAKAAKRAAQAAESTTASHFAALAALKGRL